MTRPWPWCGPGGGGPYGGAVSEPEDESLLRRVPPLTWIGLLFVAASFLIDDVRALYVGGALLIVASLQWGRPRA